MLMFKNLLINCFKDMSINDTKFLKRHISETESLITNKEANIKFNERYLEYLQNNKEYIFDIDNINTELQLNVKEIKITEELIKKEIKELKELKDKLIELNNSLNIMLNGRGFNKLNCYLNLQKLPKILDEKLGKPESKKRQRYEDLLLHLELLKIDNQNCDDVLKQINDFIKKL